MTNEVKLVGKYLGASAIREVGINAMKVRDFWIDISDNPEYPNTPELNLSGDKCALVEGLTKGAEIEVFARLAGNKFRDKEGKQRVFTNIRVWRINVVQRQSAAFVSTPTEASAFSTPSPIDAALKLDDDLPF